REIQVPPPGPLRDRRQTPDSAMRPRAQRCFEMFDSLSEKLGLILDRLTRRGALSEADVEAALREIRRALLEDDVALDVARELTEQVEGKAVGVEVMKSVTPGQMVVKIVHDQLVATLGAGSQGARTGIDLNAAATLP